MKFNWKTAKRIGIGILLIYTHWTAYDHGRSFPSHLKDAKNMVEQAAHFTATMWPR